MTAPPVMMARSSSKALRRSPKPGAFTARLLMVPRSLLTTQGRQGFALHVLSDDDQRPPPALGYGFQRRHHVGGGRKLLVGEQEQRLFEGTLPCGRRP